MPKRLNSLISLTTAAMALPAFAASPPAESILSITGSTYNEESISPARTLFGSTDRYDIDIGQFHLLTPIRKDWSAEFTATRESMSGASPWGTARDVNGDTALIMSGATIDEGRNAYGIKINRYGNESSYSVAVQHSRENDYKSKGLTLGGEWNTSNKMTTFAVSANYSTDDITPTDALLFNRIAEAKKNQRKISFSVTQIINRSSVIQVNLGYANQRGYLSDPYKLRDVRPDRKKQRFLSGKYRHFVEPWNGALNLDYRYYNDSFGVHSQTFEMAWHQNIGSGFRVTPFIRYYRQSEAEFFTPVDDFSLPLTIAQSSDHRLGQFDANTYGLRSEIKFSDWKVRLSYMQYDSEDGPDSHPANVNFSVFSLGLEWRF
jgi:hypothetical protein